MKRHFPVARDSLGSSGNTGEAAAGSSNAFSNYIIYIYILHQKGLLFLYDLIIRRIVPDLSLSGFCTGRLHWKHIFLITFSYI